jgi:xylan 1,4-beta-xylosidase
MIQNPILPGFHPDPSILRVGADFYIATSTFEWFPGVMIHHSRNLIDWEICATPLDRVSQLDMAGNPDSCGIWAPCLSHDGNMFYLIYTDVKNSEGIYKDSHNYLVTSPSITGPWSEPVYMNSSGFDPSLFHDSDGKKWFVNVRWDHRKGKNQFGGIILQEYDSEAEKLTGPIVTIFTGTPIGLNEAPHLYKRNGWYYLMTAEGGTFVEHAVTLARSKSLEGPYELHPQNPILTSYGYPVEKLQRAGHASLVDTPSGEWYLAHLCGRSLPGLFANRCFLGRETALQKVCWGEDGWLRLSAGGNRPFVEVDPPSLDAYSAVHEPLRDDFDATSVSRYFQSLRVPMTEDWATLTARKGYLRLFGRESLSSCQRQSLVARRLTSFQCEAECSLDFNPDTFQQMAGLVCYYNTILYHYLYVTFEEGIGNVLNIVTNRFNGFSYPLDEPVTLGSITHVLLRATVDNERLRFSYSLDGTAWLRIGPACDMAMLSDEATLTNPGGRAGFTGTLVGICAQDLSGRKMHADFDYFEYRLK